MHLTNEQLVDFIQKGINKKKNLELLYLHNKAMISKIAYKYTSLNDYDDLMQEGYLGLSEAAEKYDPKMGCLFISYATYCIRSSILKYKHSNITDIRIPEWMYQRICKYKSYLPHYRKANGKDPEASEIMKVLDLTPDQEEEIRRVIAILSSSVSLEMPVDNEEDDITYADTVIDPDNPIDDLLDAAEKQELKMLLWDIVDDLQGKQPDVLRMRFQEGKTLNECAEILHVKSERVRQIQSRGLRKIREVHTKELLPYCHDFIYSQGLKHTGFRAFKHTGESSVERAVRLLEKKREEF